MSRRRLAIEEPGLRQPEGAGTHRPDQRMLRMDRPEPRTELVVSRLGSDDHYVGVWRIRKAVIRDDRHARLHDTGGMNRVAVASHGVKLERHLLVHVAAARVDIGEDLPRAGV